MKRTILKNISAFMLLASLGASTSTKADDPAFDKGSNTIGLSVGVGVNYGYYDYVNLPAVTLLYDHGTFGDIGPGTIGIGGILGFKTSYYDYPDYYGDDYHATLTNYVIAARGTYHLTILKDKNNKFDPYAGIVIGVRINKYTDTYNDYYYSTHHNYYYTPYRSVDVVKGVFIGAKYNFTPFFGCFAELGYDISILRVGINFNFGK